MLYCTFLIRSVRQFEDKSSFAIFRHTPYPNLLNFFSRVSRHLLLPLVLPVTFNSFLNKNPVKISSVSNNAHLRKTFFGERGYVNRIIRLCNAQKLEASIRYSHELLPIRTLHTKRFQRGLFLGKYWGSRIFVINLSGH